VVFRQRRGIVQQVRNSCAPPDSPLDILYITGIQGFEIARIERPTYGGDGLRRPVENDIIRDWAQVFVSDGIVLGIPIDAPRSQLFASDGSFLWNRTGA
jgi:hypothetical protein